MKKTATKKEHQVVGSVPFRKANPLTLFMRVAGGDGTANGEKFSFSAGISMESLFVEFGPDTYFVHLRDLVEEIVKLRAGGGR